MKKVLSLLFLGLLIAFTSCDEEAIENIEENVVGTLTCNFNGQTWEAQAPVAKAVDTAFVITGIKNSQSVVLAFKQKGVASHPVNNLAGYTAVFITNTANAGTTSHYAVSGTLEITEDNTSGKKVSGKFDFIAVKPSTGDTVTISNGVFSNVNYP